MGLPSIPERRGRALENPNPNERSFTATKVDLARLKEEP